MIIIIAGGSGTRLWPLSVPDYPKHLLKINESNRSLLEQTYQRSKEIAEKVFIVSEIGHIEHVKKQLKDLPLENFIVEPSRKGTANCILMALIKIKDQINKDEPIAIISADHSVRDVEGFKNSFSIAGEVSRDKKRIVLIGIEPNYPATGFGYIEKDKLMDGQNIVYKVRSFKEKPDFNTAKSYLKNGNYLWNSGYFVASFNVFIEQIQKYSEELYKNYLLLSSSISHFNQTYLKLDNQTIDYGLIEKVRGLIVVPASFDWLDLGSFSDLHKAVDNDELGNHFEGVMSKVHEVENSLVINKENKPIITIGLDNIVVINTKEGLLISRKDLSQKVGDLSKELYK